MVSEELSRFFFVWLTFIGAIVAMHEGSHLGMDSLVARLSRRGKLVCLALSQALILMCESPFLHYKCNFSPRTLALPQVRTTIAIQRPALARSSAGHRRGSCRLGH